MEQRKCINCGGAVAKEDNGTIKCLFCGSVFSASELQPAKPAAPPEAVKNNTEPTTAVPPATPKDQNGCAILAFLTLIVIIVFFLMTQQHRSYDGYSSNAVDSLAIDSTAIFEESGASVSTNAYEAELRELLSINIDSVAFKKLYKNARKKHDEFSEQTFIYDKSSPQYVNVAGVFVYISKDGNQYSINLVNQYTADDWLFIKSLVFNTDGENASFEWDFKRDNDDGMIWEWSDIEVPSPTLSMLIDIANAKKAKVRYEGDKYYKAVVITATEKAALKRQLKLYKGLLLGYGR